MTLPRRALFLPGKQRDGYVAVKRIPIGGGLYIEPGDPIPEGYKKFRLQAWYRRGVIGAVGDDWTNRALGKMAVRRGREHEALVKAGRIEPAEPAEPESIIGDSAVERDAAPATEPATPKTAKKAGPRKKKTAKQK